MRISEIVRLFLILSVPIVLALGETRCTPSEPCVRISDCDDGQTCSKGRCIYEAPTATNVADAALEGTAPSASDASSSKDAATSTMDASTTDASADADADVDGGSDGGVADASGE